jgi:hypothetical protein
MGGSAAAVQAEQQHQPHAVAHQDKGGADESYSDPRDRDPLTSPLADIDSDELARGCRIGLPSAPTLAASALFSSCLLGHQVRGPAIAVKVCS